MLTGNTYDKYTSSNGIERRLMQRFLRAFDESLPTDPPARVLEIGAGEGEISSRVVERFPGAAVISADLPDPARSREWAERGLNGLFGDVEALPFADDTFDLVLVIEVLEHVPDPDLALSEIARVGRGHVIASVPFEPLWRAANMARGKYFRDWGNTPGHIQHWGRRGFVRLVGNHLQTKTVRRPIPWTMVAAQVQSVPSATS